MAAILGLLAAALQPRRFPTPRPDGPIVAAEGLLVLLLVALVVSLADGRGAPPAGPRPAPARRQDGGARAGLAQRRRRAGRPGRGPRPGRRGALGPRLPPGPLALLDLRDADPIGKRQRPGPPDSVADSSRTRRIPEMTPISGSSSEEISKRSSMIGVDRCQEHAIIDYLLASQFPRSRRTSCSRLVERAPAPRGAASR